jgi:ACT domain-containing protein
MSTSTVDLNSDSEVLEQLKELMDSLAENNDLKGVIIMIQSHGESSEEAVFALGDVNMQDFKETIDEIIDEQCQEVPELLH